MVVDIKERLLLKAQLVCGKLLWGNYRPARKALNIAVNRAVNRYEHQFRTKRNGHVNAVPLFPVPAKAIDIGKRDNHTSTGGCNYIGRGFRSRHHGPIVVIPHVQTIGKPQFSTHGREQREYI